MFLSYSSSSPPSVPSKVTRVQLTAKSTCDKLNKYLAKSLKKAPCPDGQEPRWYMALHLDKESSSHLKRKYIFSSYHVQEMIITQQRDDNSLNSAIGTTHCCLKAYGTKGHLSSKILPFVGLDLYVLILQWSGTSFFSPFHYRHDTSGQYSGIHQDTGRQSRNLVIIRQVSMMKVQRRQSKIYPFNFQLGFQGRSPSLLRFLNGQMIFQGKDPK